MPDPHRIWRPGQDALVTCTLHRAEKGRDILVGITMVGGAALDDHRQLATAFGFLADQLAQRGMNPMEILAMRPAPLPGTVVRG